MNPITIPMQVETSNTTIGMSVGNNQEEIAFDVDHVTTPVEIDFTADAETLPAGSSATVEYSQKNFHFAIPQGAKGDKGDKGDPGIAGYSPSASVSKSGSVTTLTVTDQTGTTTAEINDGTTPDMSAYRTAADQDVIDATIPKKVSDLNNDAGYITGMYIAAYGKSTYSDILAAYQANKVVYCRASSNTNPGTGNQLRMAFLAYVNNETAPTEFEFQYYRSVSTHSDSQQGDQVYVYKINSSGAWSVTTREAYTKIKAGAGLTSSYSNGVLTISLA